MRFEKPVALKQIATLIGAELVGNTEAAASGINEIHKVEEGDLVFVDHPKYYDKCINSAASFIIINKNNTMLIPNDRIKILHRYKINRMKPFTSKRYKRCVFYDDLSLSLKRL